MNKHVPVWLTIAVAITTLVLGSFAMRVIDGATDAINAVEMQSYVEKELDHTEERWEDSNNTILQFMESQTQLNKGFVGEMQDLAVRQAEMKKDIEHLKAE